MSFRHNLFCTFLCLCLTSASGCEVEQLAYKERKRPLPPEFDELPPDEVIYPPAQPTPRVGDTSFYSAASFDGTRVSTRETRHEWERTNTLGQRMKPPVSTKMYTGISEHYGKRLVHLHAQRGLEVLDISDVSDPVVVGTLRIEGVVTGLEVFGRYALVFQGSRITVVDLARPTRPVEVSSYRLKSVPEVIEVRDNGVLYLLVVRGDEPPMAGQWELLSLGIDVEDGELRKIASYTFENLLQTEVVSDGETLAFVRDSGLGNQVQIVDISSPLGAIDTVGVIDDERLGRALSVPSLGINGGFLSVVTRAYELVPGSVTEDRVLANVITTYDIGGIGEPIEVDSELFGYDRKIKFSALSGRYAVFVLEPGEDAEAPMRRVAFNIEEDGSLTVAGLEDYKAIAGVQQGYSESGDVYYMIEESLIEGLGQNPTVPAHTFRISIRDVSTADAESTDTLLSDTARYWRNLDVSGEKILFKEGVVEHAAEDGTPETGILVVPYSGHNLRRQRHLATASIYTFSKTSLTYRGDLPLQDAPIQRIALIDDDLLFTSSTTGVRMIDISDPSQPEELSHVDVVPVIEGVWSMGEHVLRQRSTVSSTYWWEEEAPAWLLEARLEVMPADDVEYGEPIAEITIPSEARILQDGDRFVILSEVDSSDPEKRFYIEYWDFSDPAYPFRRGALQTHRPAGFRSDDSSTECPGCLLDEPFWDVDVKLVGDKLVFADIIEHEEYLGVEFFRTFRPRGAMSPENRGCSYSYPADGVYNDCIYHIGAITCSQISRVDLTRYPEVCSGEVLICRIEDQAKSCQRTSPNQITLIPRSRVQAYTREWQSVELRVIDLSGGGQFQEYSIRLPEEEQAAGWVVDGDRLYVNFKLPHKVEGDHRSYMRYYTRRIDLDVPGEPVLGEPINLPGRLLAARGDTSLTHDYLWGDVWTEGALHKLSLDGNTATLDEIIGRYEDARLLGEFWLESGRVVAMAEAMTPKFSGDVEVERPDPFPVRLLGSVSDFGRRGSVGVRRKNSKSLVATDDALVFSDGVVYDVRDLERPRIHQYLSIPLVVYGTALVGERLLVASGAAGIKSFDIGIDD